MIFYNTIQIIIFDTYIQTIYYIVGGITRPLNVLLQLLLFFTLTKL